MDSDTSRTLRRLRRAARTAELHRPLRLSLAYLEAVRRVERLPENRSGADKSWVERLLAGSRQHFRRARRIR